MADFFFFTDIEAIQNQTVEQAFGPVPNNSLSYRINNVFSISEDASAIAIVEGIILVQQCDANPDCVNIVLFPIKNPNFNFPSIKVFIYRGIKKASIFDGSGNVPVADGSWKENNIRKVLHDLQEKINTDVGTTAIPKAENLGYHYSDVSDTENFKAGSEYLEKVIFLRDNLQLPLVKAGCQIGKFQGDSTAAGFQIILDRVGYEPTLDLTRKDDDIITVNDLPPNPTNIQNFRHRHDKEAILTSVDPAAFYGCAKANKQKVRAYQNTADINGSKRDALDIVNLFFNKNVCYLDIRNDYNYSFNYYENFRNIIRLGFLQSDTNELLVNDINYYGSWPLFRIENQKVPKNKPTSAIFLELPINDTASFNAQYFLRSYGMPFVEKGESTFLQELNSKDSSTLLRKDFNEAVKINGWVNEDGVLGTNYLSFKYAKHQISTFTDDIISKSSAYDLVFPLEMKAILGDDDLSFEDGDFKVFIYSSENAPIAYKNTFNASGEFYTQYIGIAQDKNNTSFFSFPDYIGHDNKLRLKYPFSIVRSGIYDNSIYLDEFEYDPANENIGFLAALPYRAIGSNLELKKIKQDFNGQLMEFLYYLNTAPAKDNTFYVDAKKIHVVTITNDEYNTIMSLKASAFDEGYKVYLNVDNNTAVVKNREDYVLGALTLKLKGITFNAVNNVVEIKELIVEDPVSNEITELNFYLSKT